MANNLFIRSGGVWLSLTRLTSDELRRIDLAQKKAINGEDGGTWAPTTEIVLGGSGLRVTGALKAGGTVETPAFSLTGLTAFFATGTTLTLQGTAKVKGPGAAFTITDKGNPAYSPIKTFVDRACPFSEWPGNSLVTQNVGTLYTLTAPFPTGAGFFLHLPPGAIITDIHVYTRTFGTAGKYTGLALELYEHTAGVDADKSYGKITDVAPYAVSNATPFHAFRLLKGLGLPLNGLIVKPNAHYMLYVSANGNDNVAGLVVSPPYISGSLSELRTV